MIGKRMQVVQRYLTGGKAFSDIGRREGRSENDEFLWRHSWRVFWYRYIFCRLNNLTITIYFTKVLNGLDFPSCKKEKKKKKNWSEKLNKLSRHLKFSFRLKKEKNFLFAYLTFKWENMLIISTLLKPVLKAVFVC